MPTALYLTDSDEANELLAREPLALLIGFALDQQVTVPTAFLGPLKLRDRLGSLDAGMIAALDPAKLEAAFRERPADPPLPGRHGEARAGAVRGRSRGLRRRRGADLDRGVGRVRPPRADRRAARLRRDEDRRRSARCWRSASAWRRRRSSSPITRASAGSTRPRRSPSTRPRSAPIGRLGDSWPRKTQPSLDCHRVFRTGGRCGRSLPRWATAAHPSNAAVGGGPAELSGGSGSPVDRPFGYPVFDPPDGLA